MIKSSKLATAIAVASAMGATGVNAACPTGTNDVTVTYASVLAAPNALGRTFACEFTGATNTTVTLDDTANNLYVLNGGSNAGKVEVGASYDALVGSSIVVDNVAEQPATLVIEAGALIIGDNTDDNANEPDRLIINRGSQVQMNGTVNNPIRFTGRQAVESNSVARKQWGGVYLNGYGFNNGCDDAQIPAAPTECQRSGEADTGFHGGTDNADSSGTIEYVTVAHAGDSFSASVDLNGVAFQSVGSGTTVDNLQVHNNVDDGVEFYGGAVRATNLVLTENGDDSLDSTEGWQGSAQFVVITQTGDSDQHDRAFESDNNKSPNDAALQTNALVANVTIIRDTNVVTDSSGNRIEPDLVKVRRGSALDLSNVVISSPNDTGACFDIKDNDGNGSHASAPAASGTDASGNPIPNNDPAVEFSDLDQVFHDCFERDDTSATVTWLDTDNAGEVVAGTLSLDGVVNGANEAAVAAATLPAGFEQVSFIGAVESCDSNWTATWTIPGTLPVNSLGGDCVPAAEGVNVPVMGWAGLIALLGGLAGVATRVRRVK